MRDVKSELAVVKKPRFQTKVNQADDFEDEVYDDILDYEDPAADSDNFNAADPNDSSDVVLQQTNRVLFDNNKVSHSDNQ